MSKLQTLINNHKDQLALDKQIMEQRAAEHQAALVTKARERLRLAAEKWGLNELLGLHKVEEYPDGKGVVRWVGEICTEDVCIATHAETTVADWGNVEIGFQDWAGFGRYEQASPAWSEAVFTPWMVKFAATFLDERAAMLALRQPRLAAARKLVTLAKAYEERVTFYRALRLQWAERWTRELWKPWELWRVRYVPICAIANDALDLAIDVHGPEIIMCLEGPDEIVEALRHYSTATVHRVETDGRICEMEIASFLDAEVVPQEEISIGKSLPYHRRYSGRDVVVNVPATEEREPTDTVPELADFVRWVAEVDDTLGVVVARFYDADYGWGDIIERSPEQWVEDWGKVFD